MTWLEPPFPWEAPGLNAGERQALYEAWCQEVMQDQELKYLERTGERPTAGSGLVQVTIEVTADEAARAAGGEG